MLKGRKMKTQSEISKEYCIQKYREYKETHHRIPTVKEYLEFAGFNYRKLIRVYGDDAYSKLQIECGDSTNKLNLERTPLEKIMQQYGALAMELGKLPSSSHWIHHGLKPSISGLEKPPHFIKWSEFPLKFKAWAEQEGMDRYKKVLEYINCLTDQSKSKMDKNDREFQKIIDDIRMWSPARRRNSEGEYKIELRKHLEKVGYELNEEFGESNFDLLVNKKYAVEIKKDPQQSDYDRLFGQLARHLQHQINVIALIMDAPSEDKLSNFRLLVDVYFEQR